VSTSPEDRANLAPVDIGRRFWTPYLHKVFRTQDFAAARGTGVAGDMSTQLGVGYYNAQGQLMRGTAADNSYNQGRRGHMDHLPTPQALIRQVTGVGDPPQGR
jgi:hypothetical protein